MLADIKKPIKEEMKLFEKKFYDSVRSDVFLLDKITKFILKTKGKQIRPILVFLCAKLTGEITEKTYRGAAMVELIHTATLIHDDVVDDSQKRRGFFSINALWKNKIAVLVGDYLLSKSVILSTENQDFDVLGIVSRVIKEMSEGELLQLEKARKLDITEEIYYEVIRKKTASLMVACCEIGAISLPQNEATLEKIRSLGEAIGMAFQIKDDLLDYLKTNIIGKPSGNDIQEKKITLPLIFALKSAENKVKKYHLDTIKNHSDNAKRVEDLINFVKKEGGIDYAISVMENYRQKAVEILNEFPDNEAKIALKKMIDYTTKREF